MRSGRTTLTGLDSPPVAFRGHLLPRRPHPKAVEMTGETTEMFLRKRQVQIKIRDTSKNIYSLAHSYTPGLSMQSELEKDNTFICVFIGAHH